MTSKETHDVCSISAVIYMYRGFSNKRRKRRFIYQAVGEGNKTNLVAMAGHSDFLPLKGPYCLLYKIDPWSQEMSLASYCRQREKQSTETGGFKCLWAQVAEQAQHLPVDCSETGGRYPSEMWGKKSARAVLLSRLSVTDTHALYGEPHTPVACPSLPDSSDQLPKVLLASVQMSLSW